MRTRLGGTQAEADARKKEKEEKEKREKEEKEAAANPKNKRGGSRRSVKTGSDGATGSDGKSGSGSDGLRRGSSTGVPAFDREKKKSSSGVMTIKMPSKVTQTVDDPNISFMQLCELGDQKALKEALKKPEQVVRMEDDKGEMPIHKLARHGCVDVTRDILDRCAKADAIKTDLNWQDKQGKTPIFYAVQHGQNLPPSWGHSWPPLAPLTASEGLGLPSALGRCSLRLTIQAVEYGHAALVQIFLDRGADVMVENNNGWTVLHSAVNTDKLDCCQTILEHPRVAPQKRRLLDASDKSKRQALHIASFKSREGEVVELLLKHGADASAQDASGNTGAKLAAKTGRRKSKELLEEHLSNEASFKKPVEAKD